MRYIFILLALSGCATSDVPPPASQSAPCRSQAMAAAVNTYTMPTAAYYGTLSRCAKV